jgi:hypothetical protein
VFEVRGARLRAPRGATSPQPAQMPAKPAGP